MKTLHINRHPAVIIPPQNANITAAIAALSLSPVKGAIALVGGAGKFDTEGTPNEKAAAREFLTALVAVAERKSLAVVDGGTESGIMRMVGEAYHKANATFPLIGVAPLGKVNWAGRDASLGEPGNTLLESHHSAYILIDADQWGHESKTITTTTFALAPEHRAVQVVINGGDVTAEHDIAPFIERGGPVMLVNGTGRLADELVAQLNQSAAARPELRSLLESGQLHTVDTHITPQSNDPSASAANWFMSLLTD